LLFGGLKANAQLIIDDFINSTLLTNPPGLSASSTVFGAGTFTDLRQIQDTASVLGGKRTLISA